LRFKDKKAAQSAGVQVERSFYAVYLLEAETEGCHEL
jgi:hypothetical protein